MQNDQVVETPTSRIILAWAFAGIPLLGGVIQTMINAAKLFH